jgi:hypothetical protein
VLVERRPFDPSQVVPGIQWEGGPPVEEAVAPPDATPIAGPG